MFCVFSLELDNDSFDIENVFESSFIEQVASDLIKFVCWNQFFFQII